MYGFRVTKYNPRNRDVQGVYRGEEWTSASQIGKTVGGARLTQEEYLRVERSYLAAMRSFLEEASLKALRVCSLEQNRPLSEPVGDGLEVPRLRESQILSGGALERVSRAVLREILWCKLEDEKGRFYAHFGYEYYMYLGSHHPSPRSLAYSRALGLFVELMSSPYLPSPL